MGKQTRGDDCCELFSLFKAKRLIQSFKNKVQSKGFQKTRKKKAKSEKNSGGLKPKTPPLPPFYLTIICLFAVALQYSVCVC